MQEPFDTAGMNAHDKRNWSVMAHLSVLLWLILGPASWLLAFPVVFVPVVPLILWLVYKNRSPGVAFHALRALRQQLAWVALFSYVIFSAGRVYVGALMNLVVPLLWLAPIIHGLYAAYRIDRGADHRHPLIGDLAGEACGAVR